MQYVNFPLSDNGAGIDALSSEAKIPEGHSERLVNVDPTPEGYLRKRTGYSSASGWIPARVVRFENKPGVDGEPDKHCFYLDAGVDVTSIDLSSARSSPLLVYGKLASNPGEGDFSNENVLRYYAGFSPETRNIFTNGTSTNTLLGTEHGKGPLLFLGLAKSLSVVSNSNEIIYPDFFSVDKTSDDVTVQYTNSTPSFEGFIYALSAAPSAGTTYTHVEVGPTLVINIPAGDHQLSNTNILCSVYSDDGVAYQSIEPDTVTVSALGDVTLTFTEPQANVTVLLRTAPAANVVADTVPPGQTIVKTFPITQPYLLTAAYEEDLGTEDKLSALPDSLVIDSETMTATVTYTNESGVALNFILYFDYGALVSNKLCVEAINQDITNALQTSEIQLSIYGLSHAEIYSPLVADQRPGWVTHIDNYRSEAEERLVAGLGGNIFAASDELASETYYPRIRARVSTTTNIGPAFAEGSSRSRGYLSFDRAEEGFARGTSAIYEDFSGWVRYALAAPGVTTNGTLSEIIHTSVGGYFGQEDYLEVSQSAHPEHSGSFAIKDVALGADVIYIWVNNPLVTSSDYDETDSGMLAGIYTDEIPLSGVNPFMPDDLLISDLFSDDNPMTVVSSNLGRITVRGVSAELSVPVGLRIAGERVSNVIPLRNMADQAAVEGIVRGDTISYSAIERKPQVKYANTLPDVDVSISGNGELATVTLSSGDTSGLFPGQTILLNYASEYTGAQTVVAVLSPTEWTFHSSLSVFRFGSQLGKTIELNETLTIADSQLSANTISVPVRWVPAEAPETTQDKVPSTIPKYLDVSTYVNQPIVRSTMANDNMYLTNGQDEVLKYDGENLYRAGLPTWQLGLFTAVDTTDPSIVINLPTIPAGKVSALSGNTYTVEYGQEGVFVPGDLVSIVNGSSVVQGTVTKVFDNSGATTPVGYISIATSSTLPAGNASTSITLVGRYRYYLRLNAIDKNNNIIASTVVQSSDFYIDVSQSCSIRHRISSLPVFGAYDYDRIEAEVYRTKLGTAAPFYRLATIPMPFSSTQPYVDFVDTMSDDTLTEFDAVSTALEGAELGNGWSDPIRAKYVTSAANSLVLANLKDYPGLTMRLVNRGLPITTSQLSGKIFTVRKDNRDTISVTNNIDCQRFELMTSGDIAATPGAVAGNSLTVTAAGTYATGDWVYLFRDAAVSNLDLRYAGLYQVETGGTGSFTIVTGNLTSSGGVDVNRLVRASAPKDIPVWLGTDGNRMYKDANTTASIYAAQNAVRRLSDAVNSAQSVCRTEGFKPWLSALAGNDFANGEIILRQPLVLDTTFELQLPSSFNSAFYIFVNDVKRADSAQISSITRLFPSRVVVSYENFPEIFNRPTGTSSRVFDVNPADGQEITGVIPFFGESAFGASAKSAIVVVFKTNSIYLIDLSGNTIDGGRIQKVDSRGLGCTAPFSIAPTQNGIMFANDSGLYRLRQDLTVQYTGRKLERIWQGEVDNSASARAVMAGHYSALGNQYKLSCVTAEGQSALVYNTVREYSPDGYRDGSWTIYAQHPAVGWANSTSSSFFANTSGDVVRILSRSDEKPFRDQGAAIPAVATLRALDFGDASLRKAISTVTVAYRTELGDDTGTEILTAIDLKDQFEPADRARVYRKDSQNDGLGATGDIKVQPIQYSCPKRKGLYFQLQIRNEELDSPMDIADINIRVAGISDRGVVQAKDS